MLTHIWLGSLFSLVEVTEVECFVITFYIYGSGGFSEWEVIWNSCFIVGRAHRRAVLHLGPTSHYGIGYLNNVWGVYDQELALVLGSVDMLSTER